MVPPTHKFPADYLGKEMGEMQESFGSFSLAPDFSVMFNFQQTPAKNGPNWWTERLEQPHRHTERGETHSSCYYLLQEENQLNYSGLTDWMFLLLSFHYGSPIFEEIPPTLSLPSFISPLCPERTIFLRVAAHSLIFSRGYCIVLHLRLIFQEEIWIIG